MGYSVYYLEDVIFYAYRKYCFAKQLKKLALQYPQVSFVLCTYGLGKIKTPSPLEKSFREKGVQVTRKEMWEYYFDEVFGKHGHDMEYYKECITPYKTSWADGTLSMIDCQGLYKNIVNGCRVTTDIPEDAESTIYMFGNSVCFGIGTDDKNSIASNLQRKINEYYGAFSQYAVMNCANISGSLNYSGLLSKIRQYRYKPGDVIAIILVGAGIYSFDFDCLTCDFSDSLQRPHNMGEVYVDQAHMNSVGYRAMGEKLFEVLSDHGVFQGDFVAGDPDSGSGDIMDILSENKTDLPDNNSVPIRPASDKGIITQSENIELLEYLDSIRVFAKPDAKLCGAVVMNCNPFTIGHRYLVEYASSRMDHLYVFVVEEDKSVFPFQDRLELVRAGTENLRNVTVIPSGKFIISQKTFEAYFKKDQQTDIVIDASKDITIFADKIAPTLNISVRFVGQEPLCNITRQYNASMKRILPEYGIEFVIIPRKGADGEPISASRVRRLIEDKRFEEISHIVPKTTFEYLVKRYGNQ